MKSIYQSLVVRLSLGLLLLACGCENAVAPTVTGSATEKPANSPPTTTRSDSASVPAEVTLKTAGWEEAQTLIAEQRGKVVVFDIWSTSCPPCVREFPGLVKLQQEFPADVVCISFNCDYIGLGKPEDDSALVLEFLKEQSAKLVNLLSSDADEEVLKKGQLASFPVVRVYGRDGELVKQFDEVDNKFGADGFTYAQHVQPLVSELVK